ncbi:hypothetical protein CBS101457_001982 [Exobasidium rhododendri]|nr:hypothetical protein CBS101457_001982 [Exobasidium rhododendri]
MFDFGVTSDLGTKHRLTPQELNLSFASFTDEDYFSMETAMKRQRVNQESTRSSSASLASSASSATPSEADSDLLDRGLNDEDATFLRLDHLTDYSFATQQSTLSGPIGLGFQSNFDRGSNTDLNHSKSNLTIKAEYVQEEGSRQYFQQQQQPLNLVSCASTSLSHASVALNTFNLSDFISDHEQEQQQQMEFRSNQFTTPERPMAHRDLNRLMARSNSFSPLSSSIATQISGSDSIHFNLSPLNDDVAGGERIGDHSELFNDRVAVHHQHHHLSERPSLPLRSFSVNDETLSCNPAHITPSHGRQSSNQFAAENKQRVHDYFFSSPTLGCNETTQKMFARDTAGSSPHSQFSSPSQSNYNVLGGADDHKGVVFDEKASSNLFHEARPMALAYFTPHSRLQSLEKVEENKRGQRGIGGVVRSGRTVALAAMQQSSPYQSPSLKEKTFEKEIRLSNQGQIIPGIITKRSRGRRVPNNPEEINNLGKSGKVYTCKVPGCGKCFKRSEHLKRHVRSIHTDEKPFTCHCGKTFSRHDNLNQHARVHAPGGSGEDEVDSPLSMPEGDEDNTVSPSMSLPLALANAHIALRPSVNTNTNQTLQIQEEEGNAAQMEALVLGSKNVSLRARRGLC